jgi:hypothetical protein
VAGHPASSTYPIALVGRAPTKVSTVNGSIKPGDLLAPSTIPGVAVKATTAGPTVGQALESYDGADVGLIETLVHPLWWGGDQPAPTSTVQQTVIINNTTVTTTTTSLPTVYRGFAKVAAGDTKVHVSYPSLRAYPIIQATPSGETDGGWWISGETDIGFDIVLKQPQMHDVTFSWSAEATTADNQVYLSNGTITAVDPTTGSIVNVPTAPTSTEPQIQPAASTSTTDSSTTTTITSDTSTSSTTASPTDVSSTDPGALPPDTASSTVDVSSSSTTSTL